MTPSIYKRTPIVHKLPSDWANMDAARFNNIAQITGLKHIDNAFAVPQNSTYDCKNVYQDESGNITIRPSLRCKKKIDMTAISGDKIEILGMYHTLKGDILHYRYWSTYSLDSGQTWIEGWRYYVANAEWPRSNSWIGPGNITIQQSDDRVYVFHTDTEGNLALHEWNGDYLIAIEPEILANDISNPIPRLYNLLSNQAKFEMPASNIKTLTADLYHNQYSTEITITGGRYGVGTIKTFILESGDVVVVSAYESYLFINGAVWTAIKLDIDIRSVVEDIVIEDYSKDGYFCINTAYINDVYSVNYTQYRISLLGTISIFEWAVDIDIDVQKNITVKPGYGGTMVLLHDNEEETYWYVRLYKNAEEIKVIYRKYDASQRFLQPYLSATTLCLYADDGAVYMYDIGGNYDDDFYANPVLSAPDAKIVTTASNVYIVHEDKLFFNYASKNNSENTYIQLSFTPDDIARFEAQPLVIIELFDGRKYLVDIKYGLRSWNEDFENSGKLAASTFDGSIFVTTLFRATSSAYKADIVVTARTLKPLYQYGKREVTDAFPLVSEIKDSVVTSFYLDNIYWFVTKHRVFGTGVVDGQFTIKYFDPRKYFHFDEEITAAIRISDTSFWVFHNDGAYLIYKGTASLYDEISGEYLDAITWLCTSTAKSKGCDFENAVMTLSVNNYVACVTSDDISVVQMRENVQTDDRILVPITLDIREFVSRLLNGIESVVTGVFKYNAVFFLNPANESQNVKALVYNTTTASWWYWEFPVSKICQTFITETGMELLAKVSNEYVLYDFYTEYYDYKIGNLSYDIYADRLFDNTPTQIDWYWESAILHFDTASYNKQLLFTDFVLSSDEAFTVSFDYRFKIYHDTSTHSSWSDMTKVVENATTCRNKNIIAKFMYLRLYMKNADFNDLNFEALTKPHFSSISLKYRLLSGGI